MKFDLDERQAEVLRTMIREHVVTGEPIGSQTLARRSAIGLSAASIRNVMSELEERGLLSQPHTSAGRVPTDKAYRVFVDQLLGRPRMAPAQARAIDEALAGGGLPDVLAAASRQLSTFSHQVGLVMSPAASRMIVDHLEFVRLDDARVVAIMVARSGVVHNRLLSTDEAIEQAELDRIGRYLSEQFGGHTLPEIREMLRARLEEERAAYDRLVRRGLELGRRTLEQAESADNVIVDGASNLLDTPEFSEPDAARRMLRALEDKTTLIDLLNRAIDGGGVQVVIGEEQPSSDLARCSLVASSYGVGDRIVGTLGIVGPTRMEYARAIALVDHLARLLSRILSRHGN